jgi:hypothetical protein
MSINRLMRCGAHRPAACADWTSGHSWNVGLMYFDALFKIGAIALLGGLVATIYFYVSRRKASPPEQAPSFALYFGVAILVGIGAYIVGTAIGIYFACSSPTSGNLCGVYGSLGVGPLLSGLALFLYGLSWRSQSHASAPVGRAGANDRWRAHLD